MENLVVLNNEKVSKQNGRFFTRNYILKRLPEGLNKYFNVELIARKSNSTENHELNLKNVKIASNIIQYLFFCISSFKKKNTKYYIISITPYTFMAYLILFICRKKVFVYLISNGHEEWKNLLGSWSIWIYDLMFSLVTSKSIVMTIHEKINQNNNTVDLYFNISEGTITKINKIIINGNKSLFTDDIKAILKSKTKSIRNIFANNNYKPLTLERDRSLIIKYYKDNGYLDIEVNSKIEYLNDNKVNIYFNIYEGEVYSIASINSSCNNRLF